AMLDAFLEIQRNPELKGMTARTLRALWRNRHRVDAGFRRDPDNRARFLQVFREPRGLTHELRRMNLYGILGHYLPPFGRIIGQMQHDLFHVYTVDEHILMVIRNLRRFTEAQHAHEYPLCSRLIADFEHKEVLYIAGLFHDIAKGRGGDHSTQGARDALRFCVQHAMPKEDANLVAWLVEHHLTMSSTAQKQDIADPNVVAAFARKVENERRLIALYLLTVADIRGTSPRVWNAWKAKLLEDLFHATRAQLTGGSALQTIQDSIEARQAEAKRLLRGYALDTFAVHDPANPLASYREAIQYVEFELTRRLAEQPPLEAPVEGRIPRQLKHFPLTPQIQIFPDDNGTRYILEVVAGDRPG